MKQLAFSGLVNGGLVSIQYTRDMEFSRIDLTITLAKDKDLQLGFSGLPWKWIAIMFL